MPDKKEDSEINDNNPKNVKKTYNRRRSAKRFLEETEDKYKKELNDINNKNKNKENKFNYNINLDKKPIIVKNDFIFNNINIGNSDYNNNFNINLNKRNNLDKEINIEENEDINSLFGKGSRRKHDTNWADI